MDFTRFDHVNVGTLADGEVLKHSRDWTFYPVENEEGQDISSFSAYFTRSFDERRVRSSGTGSICYQWNPSVEDEDLMDDAAVLSELRKAMDHAEFVTLEE